jgi:hypothetical protein
MLATVYRDWIRGDSVRDQLRAVYSRHRANPDYKPLDPVEEVERRGLFERMERTRDRRLRFRATAAPRRDPARVAVVPALSRAPRPRAPPTRSRRAARASSRARRPGAGTPTLSFPLRCRPSPPAPDLLRHRYTSSIDCRARKSAQPPAQVRVAAGTQPKTSGPVQGCCGVAAQTQSGSSFGAERLVRLQR